MVPYYKLVYISMLLTFLFPGRFLGYNLQGWLWVMTACASLAIVVKNIGRIKFPVKLWLPWILIASLNIFSGFPNAFQATIQILCPLLVGMAFSSLPIEMDSAAVLLKYTRYAFQVYFAFVCLVVIPFSMAKVENSGFAAGAITALFFQTVFLCSFLIGKQRQDLLYFLCALAIPVISSNRGPLLASLGLIVLVIAPLTIVKRMAIVSGAILFGLFAFQTEKVQKKMFHSGHGEFSDLRWDNPNLNTSGRKPMWDAMIAGIAEKPWLGRGAKADEALLKSMHLTLQQPHNDWLRITYNYGYVGVAIYLFTLLSQILLCYRMGLRSSGALRLLCSIAASCFIPYMSVMLTDNVLVYCQYYTVPHFMFVGAVHGMYAAQRTGAVRCGQGVVKLILKRVAANG